MLSAQRTPWQSVQLARELKRPHAIEVMDGLFEKFQELHGDRGYRDDPAVVGGIAELEGVGPVVVVAQQRGATTEENIARSFGMPYPEGYRKAIRLYRMAEKFHLPLVTLVDTPGAYPGPEAEERGQAEAIATSIATMTGLQTPIVAIIIGEGGSGGALALAVGDVVLALQNAIHMTDDDRDEVLALLDDLLRLAEGSGASAIEVEADGMAAAIVRVPSVVAAPTSAEARASASARSPEPSRVHSSGVGIFSAS